MNGTKTYALGWVSLIAAAWTCAAADPAGTNSLNRFTLSGGPAFNIAAKFSGGGLLLGPGSRYTPRGDQYNYDDGYVLPDASGGAGGQTWYWGYDHPEQISGNNILFSRSTLASSSSSSQEVGSGSDPAYGGELAFSRQLGMGKEVRYGLQTALNYLRVDLHDNLSTTADYQRVTDAYPFTPGTTPPLAPYQGSFAGPGFLLGTTPSSSSAMTVVDGASVSGSRKLDANVFGFRVGPYAEFPVLGVLQLSVSGGFAAAWLNASASWSDSVTIPAGISTGTSGSQTFLASGSDDYSSFLFGGYLAGQLGYQISDRWSVSAGVQYQNLGTQIHSANGRTVELDFSKTLFVTLSAGFSF